ncbi:uncharacterized protein I303_107282 [Kwoniella dejecticola CBS 10117]|uniref:Major facilitator superfamily (MFS) profile domain-containing protein n=1 Tax=Kwoniella dejecticola CBS 10117 TaxID=1296121 RepID=A0AAJ8MJQ0_9TREE
MAELKDLERTASIDKTDFAIAKTADTDIHSLEYQEYLTLSEHFTGKTLDRLHRKIDWHVLPPLMVIYMMTYVDRSNVGNAKLFGAQSDLGMNATDWNIGLSLLFISFALFAPFSAAIANKYSPRIYLTVVFFGCGASIIAAGCVANKAGWYALRLVLGLFEAGVPGVSFYVLAIWYTPGVYASRSSWFYLAATVSGAISGLLAYGIGQLDHHWGYRGWRWIYVLEGFISVMLAIILAFFLQTNPERAKKWLDEKERRFIMLRSKFEYGSDKGGNSSIFDVKAYASAFKSPHFSIIAFGHLSFATGIYAFQFTLPTIIANMGYKAAAAQGLSAPPYIAAVFSVWICGYFSDKYKQRTVMVMIPSAVAIIGLIMCWTTAGHHNLVAVTYTGCMIACIGFYPLTPMYFTFYALNNAGASKRAAALGGSMFFGQAGGVLGSNIYLASQAPKYPVGFGISAGLLTFGNLIVPALYYLWVGRINASRAAMPEEEIRAKYTPEELEAMGDRSPLYFYAR